ncbi:MAG: phosphoribosylanthranilate isomerase [Cyanobacteria bacterium P01_D01_bin.156]
MRIKICGLTRSDQAVAISNMGASVLGFICVKQSPRYITPLEIGQIVQDLPPIDRFGVFANASLESIQYTVKIGRLTGVQLHGQESPAECAEIRSNLPNVELIKALRVRSLDDLASLQHYTPHVDTFLLDAYHPEQLGGTGRTLDWDSLATFRPQRPWFLAGGLSPSNIRHALSILSPNGIDLSSSVENAPGNKNLAKVAQLLNTLNRN